MTNNKKKLVPKMEQKSDNTRVNYSPVMSKATADKRDAQIVADRKARIADANAAQTDGKGTWQENLKRQTQATGDRFRLFPNQAESFIDDYLNPMVMIGGMATGVGSIPYDIQQGNYGKAAMSVGVPVVTGAMAGIGAKNTGQFVNNLVNPVAGMSMKNYIPQSNINDLIKAKEFANKFGYSFPTNLERIAKSDKLTDMTVRGLMNKHNTFVRGVSTNWDEIEKNSPQILQHLADKGINYRTNPQQAAEYMATHVPIETGYGRVSLPGELLKNNKSAIYTSNSIPTAEGYTYGQGYIIKVKRPTDFSSSHRQDWIDRNQLDYFENELPLINKTVGKNPNVIDKLFKRKIVPKYIVKEADLSKDLLKTESNNLDKTLQNITLLAEEFYPNIPDDVLNKFHSYRNNVLGTYDYSNSDRLISRMTSGSKESMQTAKNEYNNKMIEFIKKEPELQQVYNDAISPYAHYLHIGNQGDKILDAISSKRITPEIWKNKSRAHTNTYSRGLSTASLIPAIGVGIGATQSKKSGGKLLPRKK